MAEKVNIFWFRRDLRLEDNCGFYNALSSDLPVLPIFIFDTEILDKLPKKDARVEFIHRQLERMNSDLSANDKGEIQIYNGKPEDVFKGLINQYQVDVVFTNHDYEPYARERDKTIETLLTSEDIEFKTFKDQVIFEKFEVVKQDGDPYVVYTPYMKTWKEKFQSIELEEYPSENHLNNILKLEDRHWLSLGEIGFEPSEQQIEDYDVSKDMINNYEETRNYPAKRGTSRLGPHLRFGTVSVRKMVKKASAEKNETFWQELIWREFFMQILWHHPHTVDKSFKSKYDRIEWRNNEEEFKAWQEGRTGYPLVDAGMRQLNESGYMHNRIRMLVGSFLCKHLLIDWRWGEAYFAEKLHDYEMASNVGNWQWVAGSGVDAAPYFRIFNPTTQIKKYDKDEEYIKTWVKDYNTDSYPDKIVDHKEARERCLKVYKAALN